MTHFTATKTALKAAAAKLGITLDPDVVVHRGGQDPGGWSQKGSLVCIIHEGTGIPNDYNHRDPFAWWIDLGDEVSRLTGKPMFFEWINGCVAVGYLIPPDHHHPKTSAGQHHSMTITSQWVEPTDAEHHDKIIAVFHTLFIDGGGQQDGYGDGYGGYGWGDGDGNGYGDGGRHYVPEEWRVK